MQFSELPSSQSSGFFSRLFQPELNADQIRALEVLKTAQNVFLTGKAGTGKSFLIRRFQREMNAKQMPIVASTGAAAVLVKGRTFHSFFGLGILSGGVQKSVEIAYRSKNVQKRLKDVDGVIIDEASMLSGELLFAAEQVARKVRGNSTPWGGMKIIMVGDFFQLPPVTSWGKPRDWGFQHPVWTDSELQTVSLQQVMRTQDVDFLNALNEIRVGRVSDVTDAYFRGKVMADPEDQFIGTRLYPKRDQAENFNQKKLNELKTSEHRFETVYKGLEKDIERVKPHFGFSEEVVLKEGAFVMLTTNDPSWQWHNGTTGHIVEISEEEIIVEKLNGTEIVVEPVTQEYLDANGEILVTATNFPIRLGYAVTIHKAQGMSLDRLRTDISGAWEHGQAYVALSRAKNPEGLSLASWRKGAVVVDPQVVAFYQRSG